MWYTILKGKISFFHAKMHVKMALLFTHKLGGFVALKLATLTLALLTLVLHMLTLVC